MDLIARKVLTKKRIVRAALAFGIILIIILSIYIYRTINLMIKEEILIDNGKNYEIITLDSTQSYLFEIDTEINNYWLCKAKCTDSIKSTSNDEYLFNDTFYVINNKKRHVSQLIIPKKGYGQEIFQYNIECSNIETSKCPSDEDIYRRTKTLVLNYAPDNNQKSEILKIIDLSEILSKKISESQRNIDMSSAIIYTVDIIFTKEEKTKNSELQNNLKLLKENYEKALREWENDNYEAAKLHMDETDIEIQSQKLLESLKEKINSYNEMVALHTQSVNNAKEILEIIKYNPLENEEFNNDAKTSLSLININTEKFMREADYIALAREARLEHNTVEETIGFFNNAANQTKGDYVDLYLANTLSCQIIGCNVTELDHYLDGLTDIKSRCDAYNNISTIFAQAKTTTTQNRENYNGSLDDIYLEEREYIVNILQTYNYSNQENIKLRIDEYLSELNNSNNSNNTAKEFLNSKYYSLDIKILNDNLKKIEKYCTRESVKNSVSIFNMTTKQIPEIQSDTEFAALQQPKKKCCIHNDCKECNLRGGYPLILLHGHSFNQKNSAYQSTEVYNYLESRLILGEYITLGIWTNGDYDADISIQNAQIITKPTYYITTTILGSNTLESNDENIDAYADRMNEYINNILHTTGRNKTNIVAHSMGGLVMRRYIQKYGPEKINKLILVGTPNNGIDDTTYKYCKIFGNEKECNDMHENSEFIKEVNKKYPMPNTYLIIGRGCDTNGLDGDGIVQKKNSEMDGYTTYYIDGNCTTTGYLHSAMLEKYPQVIKRIETIIE